MLGVEFEKIKNVTFLIYNEGTFFSKKDLQLHSSFNPPERGLEILFSKLIGGPKKGLLG